MSTKTTVPRGEGSGHRAQRNRMSGPYTSKQTHGYRPADLPPKARQELETGVKITLPRDRRRCGYCLKPISELICESCGEADVAELARLALSSVDSIEEEAA